VLQFPKTTLYVFSIRIKTYRYYCDLKILLKPSSVLVCKVKFVLISRTYYGSILGIFDAREYWCHISIQPPGDVYSHAGNASSHTPLLPLDNTRCTRGDSRAMEKPPYISSKTQNNLHKLPVLPVLNTPASDRQIRHSHRHNCTSLHCRYQSILRRFMEGNSRTPELHQNAWLWCGLDIPSCLQRRGNERLWSGVPWLLGAGHHEA